MKRCSLARLVGAVWAIIALISVMIAPDMHAQQTNASETSGQHSHIDSLDMAASSLLTHEKESMLLFQSLKDINDQYYEDVMKTLAFLIIAIGWFVTSDKSRQFFKRYNAARLTSIIAVAALGSIHIQASILTYLSSQSKSSLILGLNYLSAEHFNHYKISTITMVTNLIQNITLFGVLLIILISLKHNHSEV